MILIDTHTHLFLPEFDEDRDVVIQAAINAGIKEFYLPNIDSKSVMHVLELVNKYPENCFPMMGLHPTSVKENYREELKNVEAWLSKKQFYGIGETGIDLYRDKTFLREQVFAFEKQIQLSLDYKLPIIIHSRESFKEIFTVLDNFKKTPVYGIFHSFTGGIEEAKKAIEMGFKIGIGGIVTFKNSGLDKVIKDIDPRHIVLETDSPYLAPAPKRGIRNNSMNLIIIAKKIAELHHISLEEVAVITTTNAHGIFNSNRRYL